MYAKTKRGECVLDVAIRGGRLDLFHRFVKAGIKATQLSHVIISELQVYVRLFIKLGNSPIFGTSGGE